MRRVLHFAVVLLALCPFGFGQSASVAYLRTIQVPFPGATAAYSLDPNNAEASASNGVVTIFGKAPGTAKVMVVTADGVRTLPVTVLQPPPSYPAGFVPPSLVSQNGESGTYEFRYSSDPSQWQNNLDLAWRNGGRRTELRVNNATLLTPNEGSRITFPMASYTYASPSRELVLLDDKVNNSFLTVDDAIVRGVHYRQGPWEFHSGVISQTSFREFLLSADTEMVAGASRSFRLTPRSELVPNFYYFHMTSPNSPGEGGAVGSLAYRFKASDAFQYAVELGVSRGVGVGAHLNYRNDDTQVRGDFRYTPDHFAGLGVSQARGQNAHLDVSHAFNRRLSADILLSNFRYTVVGGVDTSTTASGMLRYALARHWSLNSGISASRFRLPGVSAMSTLSLPVGVDFATAHFGVGAQYQEQTGASAMAASGRQVSANARAGIAGVQVSGFASRQTNAPTLQTVVSDKSPLQEAMGTQSALAGSPDAIAGGLHDNLILAGLGYVQTAGLAISRERIQYGGSVNWMNRRAGHDQLSYNFLASRDALPTGTMRYGSHSFVYTRRLSGSNDFSVAFSLVSIETAGKSALHPRFQVEARHRFTSIPTFFAPGTHGAIAGHVFQDDAATGRYDEPARGIADVEIVLDGERRTRTDARGFYLFDHVAAGSHGVQAIPHVGAPFYFTTSSSETADINSRVNFGIAFSAGQIFGYVRNDAGHAVAGVSIRLRGSREEITVKTNDDGRFERRSLPQGTYEISVDPASAPAGYWLANLKKATVEVKPSLATETDFTLKALRSIAGKVIAYDPHRRQEVGIAGAVVILRELKCAVVTDRNGVYRFKELPAGNYTVAVVYNGKEQTASVQLSDEPMLVRDANLTVGTR